MKPEERLFSAIGGADEGLLTRSERAGERKRAWIRTGRYLVTAACLVLAAGVWLWSASITGYLPAREAPSDTMPGDLPAQQPLEELPQLEGEGQFHLLRPLANCNGAADTPPYSIYFDNELYYVYCPEAEYYIRPRALLTEEVPLCQLGIHHLSDCTLEEAVERKRAYKETTYQTVTVLDGDNADLLRAWPEGAATLGIRSSDGTAWDAAQAEDWFFPDGEGGVFVLTSEYFTEAEEGWGTRFYDIACSFGVETGEVPAWQSALEDTVRQIAEAAFAGELEAGSPLLAEDAGLTLEDLEPGEASVVCYLYTADSRDAAFTATASVEFRMGPQGPDSCLNVDLTYQQGRWLASWVSFGEVIGVAEAPPTLPAPA